ncbi:tetratricopeptide repeat protein [Isoalcanivorax indicus]|uniref:tetratricopeptide repeat protein n=1 Tax=Isoalcanivorax indicus TaxID=2202653 RepID=UPI001FE966F6|nr:tetratricopeptide repeat protein [Isoalcanivorax indicus]
MSISFTDLRAAAAPALRVMPLLLLLLGGCASRPDIGLDGASGDRTLSRHAEQRDGAAASDSDAEHIPPVPHDPAVRPIAEAATQDYFRGLQYLRNNELERALVVFQSLTSRYPALSGPWVNIGLIHLRQENWAAAERSLREAIDTNARNPYAHNALGLALREQGRFIDAKQHYQHAVTLDPLYARAHFNLGVLAELYLQDLPAALGHFREYQALQRQPDPTVANWIADLERRAPALADRNTEEH